VETKLFTVFWAVLTADMGMPHELKSPLTASSTPSLKRFFIGASVSNLAMPSRKGFILSGVIFSGGFRRSGANQNVGFIADSEGKPAVGSAQLQHGASAP